MSSKQNKKERMRRILSLIMVIAMMISLLATTIYYLAVSLSAKDYSDYTFEDFYRELLEKEKAREEAADIDKEAEETTGVECDEDAEIPSDGSKPEVDTDTKETAAPDITDVTAPFEDDNDKTDSPADVEIDPEADEKLIRVGLMYGTNVTVGFEVTTPYGFTVNRVKRMEDLSNKPLWELDITKLSVTVDANLKKSAMTYSKTSTAASVVIGGYHVEITNCVTKEEAEALIADLEPTLTELGIYAIPSYIYNSYRIRAGHYATAEEAAAVASAIIAIHPDLTVGTCAPTNTAVSVVDPLTDTILFEYDEGDTTALGLTPHDSPEGERAYLVTPAQKLYDGTFMFRRYISGSTDGVSLTDIIPLGEYIKGVLPYEISNSWPLEAQKAFAICVRSFTLSGLNRHENAYQVDVCNATHCQVYNGRARINATVEQAVEETAGLVMSYDNEIVTAFYSAVAGGVTVGVDDAWGGTARPYLVAVETPWEVFTNHSYGVWTAEVSGSELCTYLRDTKGYSSLRGEITDITVDKLAKNSTYVYQLTFTDSYGTKVTVKTTDGVRTALSKYVKSSNFVVGKGSVESENYTFSTSQCDEIAVFDKDDTHTVASDSTVLVLTADGIFATSLGNGNVITKDGAVSLDGTSVTVEKTTIYAQNKNNFIFSGKGWGHGVGLSQIGVRDLANLGYESVDILCKYFTDIDIKDWRDVIGE